MNASLECSMGSKQQECKPHAAAPTTSRKTQHMQLAPDR
jgi:hypothetical protein